MNDNDEIKTGINGGDPVKPNPVPSVDPEKNIPTKPDKNPDPTKIAPGFNEPEKNDPTRIKKPEEEQEQVKPKSDFNPGDLFF